VCFQVLSSAFQLYPHKRNSFKTKVLFCRNKKIVSIWNTYPDVYKERAQIYSKVDNKKVNGLESR